MKRSLFVVMALLLTTPALGTVTISCSDEGSGLFSITYDASGESAKVRAFALDVSIDCDANFTAISNYFTGEGNGYGIFPGSIDLSDLNSTPVWGDPIAPSSDPGASGTGLGTNRVILEMGSLYEPNLAGPLNTGTLCKLQLEGSGTCHVTIVAETTRGGVVLETGVTAEINVGAGCDVELGGGYPECWDYPGQCHGDATGDDRCDSYDWPAFRDGYYKNYWDHFPADPENPQPGEYNPCADYNRDGFVDSYDWPEFRDNYYTSVGGCATGDPYGVYLPGSTKP